MTLEYAREQLRKYGQEHVLKYFGELNSQEQQSLLEQIASTDLSVTEQVTAQKQGIARGIITPIQAMQRDEIEANREAFTQTGLEAIRAGKVAAVLLAGGMGTRLGSDHPKGMYDIGLTKPVYIFECIIRNLFDVVDQSGTWIPLFIMTSDKTHHDTTTFLKEKDYFGYDPSYIYFFQQEMAPATDHNGKVYMETKSKIASSPNGNGGWFSSMKKAGLLSVIHEKGIEWLNAFAVDNVLQRIADPCFVGAVIDRKCSVGSKVVRKADPDEKVGVMCLEDGRPSIVEYYDQTEQIRDMKNADGQPAYNFGVILNYLLQVRSLEEICDRQLPLHVVEKKIPCIDENGDPVRPDKPNGYKFETLILDMIHMMDSCLPFEVEREKEFAPVKNKTGVDSVESARALLQKNGVVL